MSHMRLVCVCLFFQRYSYVSVMEKQKGSSASVKDVEMGSNGAETPDGEMDQLLMSDLMSEQEKARESIRRVKSLD